jgi:hypothetical protein
MDGGRISNAAKDREPRRAGKISRRSEDQMLRSWGKNGSTDFNFIIGLVSGIALTLVLLFLFAVFFHF